MVRWRAIRVGRRRHPGDAMLSFPGAIVTLAAARRIDVQIAARAWFYCLLVATLAVFTYSNSSITISTSVTSITLPAPWGPIVVFLLSVALNQHFCSAYMKQNSIAKTYNKAVDEFISAEPVTSREDRRTSYMALFPSFISTIYPIAAPFSGFHGRLTYAVLKLLTDAVLLAVPTAGYLVAFEATQTALTKQPGQVSLLLGAISWPLLALSLFSTLVVIVEVLQWISQRLLFGVSRKST